MKEKVIGHFVLLLGLAVFLALAYEPRNSAVFPAQTGNAPPVKTAAENSGALPPSPVAPPPTGGHAARGAAATPPVASPPDRAPGPSTTTAPPMTAAATGTAPLKEPAPKAGASTNEVASVPAPLPPSVPGTVPPRPAEEIQPKAPTEGEIHVPVITTGPFSSKQVALTFDDGPHPTITLKVLDVLREHHIKATFFVLGERVRRYPWIVRQIVSEGHEIGNHTYSHLFLKAKRSTDEVIDREIAVTQNLIATAIGYEPQLFRPPYGAFRSSTKAVFRDHNLNVILWSVDTQDWRVRDRDRIFQAVTNHVRNGSIILFHDIHKATLQALPDILAHLEAREFECTTVGEMCGLPAMRLATAAELRRASEETSLSSPAKSLLPLSTNAPHEK